MKLIHFRLPSSRRTCRTREWAHPLANAGDPFCTLADLVRVNQKALNELFVAVRHVRSIWNIRTALCVATNSRSDPNFPTATVGLSSGPQQ